jgi:ADP-ribosylglycohydrolase
MLGAIAGDIIGSIYEKNNIKTKNFKLFSENSHFTDDTVLTIAVADAILNEKDFIDTLKEYTLKYPDKGYGENFKIWATSSVRKPYNSWGNGSAMRTSPIPWSSSTLEETLKLSKDIASLTHNHPEGIKGAQAISSAIFLARKNASKEEIKEYIEHTFGYDLNRKSDDIRKTYKFEVSCQKSVPESIISFLESSDFEDSIRIAVSLGGDSDTLAAMTGSISEAYYKGVPGEIADKSMKLLPSELKNIVLDFQKKYIRFYK